MKTEQNCWAYLDAMKKSGDDLLDKLRKRRKGWRMKEPKPDGTMIAERERKEAWDNERGGFVEVRSHAIVTGKTHAEILRGVVTADGLCASCFHKLTVCAGGGCSAKMPHLPKVEEKREVRGKMKTRWRAATCGCRANAKAAEPT